MSQKKSFIKWLKYKSEMVLKIYNLGDIKIHFVESKEDCKDSYGNMVFSVKSDEVYRRVYITIYPVAFFLFKKKDYENLLDGLTHEFAHILTYPLSLAAEDRYATEREVVESMEKLTESVAILMRRLSKYECPKLYD